MYSLLSGTHVLATFTSWSELLRSISQHLPSDSSSRCICLLTKRTREECVGKPVPFYVVFDKGKNRTLNLLVQGAGV